MHPPQELINYIKLCRNHSIADDKIKHNLITRGWRPELVHAALYESSPHASRQIAPFSDVVHRRPAFSEAEPKHAESAPGASTPEEAVHTIEAFLEHETAASPAHTLSIAGEQPSSGAVVTNTVSARQKPEKWFKSWQSYAMGGALVLASVIALAVYVFPHEAPRATAESAPVYTTVRDQNYTLVLPKGWQKNSDYHNGGGVNVFYQNAVSAPQSSRMAVFVMPKASSQGSSHTDTQITGLKQNGATATVIQQMTLSLNQTDGTLTEVKATAASDPNDVTYYMYLSAAYGDTLYNVDVTIPSNQWQQQHSSVLTSLKSFRPSNTSVTHRQITH